MRSVSQIEPGLDNGLLGTRTDHRSARERPPMRREMAVTINVLPATALAPGEHCHAGTRLEAQLRGSPRSRTRSSVSMISARGRVIGID